ncbi:PPPDE putative peptidase domain-containing protein [Geopyxis carbonaria]|nr:PPPDE putative peptidase domain-containing protein [Geopyxis carbonaria]
MADEQPVELYVYDLSQGLARTMSQQMLGVQIDAVYHTSIVLGGVEYYYGHGIQTSAPGRTHHGQPMEIVPLGTTALPTEVITEYIDSLKSSFTPESYDLFLHNCNNFTADLAMFLVGRSIPEHIVSLPQTVLATPFGQMLRPMLERQLAPITQARSPAPATPALGHRVHVVASLAEFEALLEGAKEKCAAAFFTSATCPPCRTVYPHFEELAAAAGERAVLIKVDVGVARDVGGKYNIAATPTFITWSRGEQVDRWSGASPADLKTNMQMLMAMTYPAHPHTNVNIGTVLRTSMQPISYGKIPPLDKVSAKLGALAQDPAVVGYMAFLGTLAKEGAANAPVPDLTRWAVFMRECYAKETPAVLFPLVDLFRASLADARVSGWFAEEKDHETIAALLSLGAAADTPYSLRLVTVQAACNLFTTPLFPDALLSTALASSLLDLLTTSLLDKAHSHLRVAASSLAFNIATHVQRRRSQENREVLAEDRLTELVASVTEALKCEDESKEVVKGLVLTLALGVYCAPVGGEVVELLKVLEAGKVVRAKGGVKGLGDRGLCSEVATLLEV